MSSYEAKYGSNALFSTAYVRDSLGRITEITETVQGVTNVHAYTYDLAGRLKQVLRNDTLQATYYYDANGNRDSVVTPAGTTTGTYDAQDRMLAYGNASYFYTKRGSLSTKIEGTDTTRYTYDLQGNLTRVDLPTGDVIEYLIDAQNRRIGKKVNGRWVQKLLYSTGLSPAAELDSVDGVVARFILGRMEKGGVTYRIITDHLGSVRLVVNASTGEISERIAYDEFGNVLEDTNPGLVPVGYAGGLWDCATRWVRFGTRDYDSRSARFTTKDLIGYAGGESNTYRYLNNEPVNRIDPYGLWGPEGHDLMILHSLEGKVPDSYIRILQLEGRLFDKVTQDPHESYKHAMSEADETPEQARMRTLGFEYEMLRLSRQLAQMGYTNLALKYLAAGIHPMMDATSPAHTDPCGNAKVWNGYFDFRATEHIPFNFMGLGPGKETLADMTSEHLSVTDRRIFDAYTFVFGR
jgi:RHS repeat-associated protein